MARAVKLGVMITTAILLLVIAIYLVGSKQHLFSTTFKISGVFKDVGGLQPGSIVRFSGIKVGTVENITIISDTAVKVDLLIEENIRQFIRKDSRAVIASEGVMGNKLVNITAGTPAFSIVDDNDVLPTSNPAEIDAILRSLASTVANAEVITKDLSKITTSISAGKGTIGKLFMDSSLALTVQRAMTNVEKGTGGFSQNMEALKDNFLFRGYYKKKEKEAIKAADTLNQKKRKGLFRKRSKGE